MSPAEEAEQAAVEVYDAFWIAVAAAGEIPDPNYPDLEQYAIGDALDQVRNLLIGYVETDRVSHGVPVTNPEVVEVSPAEDPDTVVIADCGDSSGWTVHDKVTDEVIDDAGGPQLVDAVVEWSDGVWRVTSFSIGGVGSC